MKNYHRFILWIAIGTFVFPQKLEYDMLLPSDLVCAVLSSVESLKDAGFIIEEKKQEGDGWTIQTNYLPYDEEMHGSLDGLEDFFSFFGFERKVEVSAYMELLPHTNSQLVQVGIELKYRAENRFSDGWGDVEKSQDAPTGIGSSRLESKILLSMHEIVPKACRHSPDAEDFLEE